MDVPNEGSLQQALAADEGQQNEKEQWKRAAMRVFVK